MRFVPMPMAIVVLLAFLRQVRQGTAGADPRPDEDLYRRFADGDVRAFRVLVERHGNPVHRYLARYLGDDEMATDVAQEVFLKVVQTAGDFRGASTFRTFLYRIARNTAVDAARARSGRPDSDARPLDPRPGRSDDDPVAEPASPAADTAHRALSGELSRAMEAGLARLPVEQREAFLLREVDGMSFPEIGAVQGVNLETARSRVTYAVKSLRRSLAGFGGLP